VLTQSIYMYVYIYIYIYTYIHTLTALLSSLLNHFSESCLKQRLQFAADIIGGTAL